MINAPFSSWAVMVRETQPDPITDLMTSAWGISCFTTEVLSRELSLYPGARVRFFMVRDVAYDFFYTGKLSHQNPASNEFLLFAICLLSGASEKISIFIEKSVF